MAKGLALALIVVIAIVIIGAVIAFRSSSGTTLTFPDGQTMVLACAPGMTTDILSASYGPQDNLTAPQDVTTKVQSFLSSNTPLVVSAAALGATAVSGGVLSVKYRCVGNVPPPSRSAFSSPPLISCDRSADLQYAVDATVRGGTAMVWTPYVLGANFEHEAKKKVSSEGFTPSDGDLAEWGFSKDDVLNFENADDSKPTKAEGGKSGKAKEKFEPVPDLSRHTCSPADDLEYRIDGTLRDAQPPQALLYSTIMNAPPALGVWNPIETESDNTVTSLYQHAHMQRWTDPYLTDAAKFGRGPYDIPPGDPGSMEYLPFKEDFASKPLITAVTGRSAPLPKRVSTNRSRDIIRHARSAVDLPPDDLSADSEQSSTIRFGRSALPAGRARGRR